MQPADQTSDLGARVHALAPMLADPDPRVRKSAVIALGRMGCPEATAALCDRLADSVEGVRVLACQALGRVADPASVPALLARVHDESAEVRAGVLWALANIAAHGGLTSEARAALFSPIVVMAFDPDDGVRADAAAVLGALRDERATDALGVLLEDGCPRVRANACASLGLLDDEAGLGMLLGVVENPVEDPLVLVSALDGLARRAERGECAEAARAVAAVCALAESAPLSAPAAEGADAPGGADVRATAVWALGYLGSLAPAQRARVQEVLAGALAGDDPWACRYAIEALARLHDDEARATLEGWASTGRAASLLEDQQTAEVLEKALETFA